MFLLVFLYHDADILQSVLKTGFMLIFKKEKIGSCVCVCVKFSRLQITGVDRNNH